MESQLPGTGFSLGDSGQGTPMSLRFYPCHPDLGRGHVWPDLPHAKSSAPERRELEPKFRGAGASGPRLSVHLAVRPAAGARS